MDQAKAEKKYRIRVIRPTAILVECVKCGARWTARANAKGRWWPNWMLCPNKCNSLLMKR